jgi:hypothetical protein
MSKETHRCGDIGLLILIYEYNTEISYCIGMVDTGIIKIALSLFRYSHPHQRAERPDLNRFPA